VTGSWNFSWIREGDSFRPVIPGRASLREPGIQTFELASGFRVRANPAALCAGRWRAPE
jgi:hypothetical protein